MQSSFSMISTPQSSGMFVMVNDLTLYVVRATFLVWLSLVNHTDLSATETIPSPTAGSLSTVASGCVRVILSPSASALVKNMIGVPFLRSLSVMPVDTQSELPSTLTSHSALSESLAVGVLLMATSCPFTFRTDDFPLLQMPQKYSPSLMTTLSSDIPLAFFSTSSFLPSMRFIVALPFELFISYE